MILFSLFIVALGPWYSIWGRITKLSGHYVYHQSQERMMSRGISAKKPFRSLENFKISTRFAFLNFLVGSRRILKTESLFYYDLTQSRSFQLSRVRSSVGNNFVSLGPFPKRKSHLTKSLSNPAESLLLESGAGKRKSISHIRCL